MTLDQPPAGADPIAARRRALDLEEEGLVGTVLVEPLTALAGGIIGGALVACTAWRLAWHTRHRRTLARPFRR